MKMNIVSETKYVTFCPIVYMLRNILSDYVHAT